MTETERRYKILKRESYEEQISKENKIATWRTFWFGFASLATLCAVAQGTTYTVDTELSSRIFDMIFGFIDANYAGCNLKKLIEAISKKTMLEGRIEDINMDLAMDEQVPSISKGR